MLRSDYILRILEDTAAVLVKVLSAGKQGRFPDAHAEIKRSAEELLGIDLDMLHKLDTGDMLSLLKINDSLFHGKCLVLARLMKAEGKIFALEGNTGLSRESYSSALYLFNEVAKTNTINDARILDDMEKDINQLREALKT